MISAWSTFDYYSGKSKWALEETVLKTYNIITTGVKTLKNVLGVKKDNLYVAAKNRIKLHDEQHRGFTL